ncbi:hypothetical protein [Gimesia aquarii]|uniref:Core-binding (CB) domain-containing protein n=1 Tax=Gimesia aquarii TaxID=2527964 RepID=A0A517VQJ1_9PLAN|nr:hypothetical protein [Gimesia aquarii]QDT95295.1 hypothetical protein V144x_07370 [Gimesia aquarii]
MPREAIKLGKPETLPSGKVRWQKSYKGNKWKSSAYDSDSRRNRADAWSDFVIRREEIKSQLEAKQKAHDESHPLRKKLTEYLQDEIELAEISENRKQSEWASEVLGIVRNANDQGLYEAAELLIPDEQTPEFKAAHNTVKSIVKNGKKNRSEFKTSELIKKWLVFRISDVKAGDITAGAMNNQRIQLKRFEVFCPNILHATAMKVADFRADLQSSGLAKTTQRDTLTTVKSFLEWCGDTAEVIEPIPNLRKPGNGIKVPTKKIITIWEDEDVTDLFKHASGRHRLYYLLMLNTGAYESDIGTWTKIAIGDDGKKYQTFDKENRTITFKRHKEKDEPEVPTVTYRLWDETYSLLVEHESSHNELLLTTTVNTPLWKDELRNGKRSAKRMIGKQYRDQRKKLNKKNWGTLDDLRKTSISKFDEHGEYARYSQYFAGHSPEGTTDRFYKKPSQKQFDNAVMWLGKQFGLK